MRNLIVDAIIKLNEIDNPDFNIQKNAITTLLEMLLNSNKFDIILEEELRNALSPVMLYIKLVKDINPSNEQVFDIFMKVYSETLTNLNHFINYTESDREKYIASVQKGLK